MTYGARETSWKIRLGTFEPRLDFDAVEVVLIVHIAQLAVAALIHFEDDVSMALRAQSGAVSAPEPFDYLLLSLSALGAYLVHFYRVETVVGILQNTIVGVAVCGPSFLSLSSNKGT